MSVIGKIETYNDRWLFLTHTGTSIVATFADGTMNAQVMVQFRDDTEDYPNNRHITVERHYEFKCHIMPDVDVAKQIIKEIVGCICARRPTLDELLEQMKPHWRVVSDGKLGLSEMDPISTYRP